MKNLARNISELTGVNGCFSFHATDGVLFVDEQLDFSARQLQAVGTLCLRLLRAGTLAGLQINSAHFSFSDYLLVGIPLAEDNLLIVSCQEHADSVHIVRVARQLIAAMAEGREEHQSADPPPEPEVAPVQTPEVAAEVMEELVDEVIEEVVEEVAELEELGDDGVELLGADEDVAQMQPYYDEIEKMLTLSIGPLADLVMRESLLTWRQNGPAIQARIFELVSLMARKIGDPALAEEFIFRCSRIC